MQRKTRRALFLTAALLAAAGAVAQAQPADPMTEATGDPLGDLLLESERTAPKPVDNAPVVYRQTVSHPLSAADAAMMRQGLEQAKRGDMTGARNTISMMSDSVARKVVTWALVDANSTSLGFYELDAARTALQGWPRAARRQAAAERTLETAGKTPQQVIAWFGSTEAQTAQVLNSLLATKYARIGQEAPRAPDQVFRLIFCVLEQFTASLFFARDDLVYRISENFNNFPFVAA